MSQEIKKVNDLIQRDMTIDDVDFEKDDETSGPSISYVYKDESDDINHPSHYTSGEIECIDAMISAFGKEEVAIYCKIAAFKYNWRMGKKAGNSSDKDAGKNIWYMTKFRELNGK